MAINVWELTEMVKNDESYKAALEVHRKMWDQEWIKLNRDLEKINRDDFPGRVKTRQTIIMEERKGLLELYISEADGRIFSIRERIEQVKSQDIDGVLENNDQEIMTADRRADLIGETITEIVQLTEELDKLKAKYGPPYFTKHIVQEKIDWLRELNRKLTHLRKEELDFLIRRRDVISKAISRCSPGEWVELEGIKGEIDSKINRLRKELNNE
ncbi:hypothetical protein JMN32_19735 [Fulvivirga sp. 29W222]|uniref:Uncharacterized protein n=1 Tax=Fulvivirga marina TaxID=2494733 RepID=A0A937G0T7_9BACT|nr:hypothetical protein [Fulvivirga marina]MBL6448552.1 hypothetical protein [Fulvivirga marina]